MSSDERTRTSVSLYMSAATVVRTLAQGAPPVDTFLAADCDRDSVTIVLEHSPHGS